MRLWKIASGATVILGLAALAVAWAPAVSGQQTHTSKSGDDQNQKIIVRQRGPMAMGPVLAHLSEGARLGVTIRDVAADDVAKLKLPGQAGVIIDEVEKDSAAAKGGVLANDVAVSFDGENVRSAMQLTRLVRETPAGRTVKMAVLRAGKRVDLSVTPEEGGGGAAMWMDEKGPVVELKRQIEELKQNEKELNRIVPRGRQESMPFFNQRVPAGPGQMFKWRAGEDPDVFAFSMGKGRLGVTVQDLTPDLAEYFGTKDGVLVSSVQKDTPAAAAGIKAGDVITALDGKSIASSTELIDQLREKSGEVSVTVMRDKKALTLKATLQKPLAPVLP